MMVSNAIIRKTGVVNESAVLEISGMLDRLNATKEDLIYIKIEMEKVDGNPLEWLQEKILYETDSLEIRILKFFIEHPLHSFKVDEIAKYLNIEEEEGIIKLTLDKLTKGKILNSNYSNAEGKKQWNLRDRRLCEEFIRKQGAED